MAETRSYLRMVLTAGMIGAVLLPGRITSAQATAPASSPSSQASPAAGTTTTPTHRRSRRRYNGQTSAAQPSSSTQQPVAPGADQRRRDAQILAAQKAQSAEIARQNAITTGNVVKEREAQQAEPRIQDAPGPGSQPMAGDPAVPPTQSSEPPKIQDAPGPAQTLPQAPPPATAQPTTPAPQL